MKNAEEFNQILFLKNPNQNQIKEFYSAVWDADVEKIKAMLEAGFPVNTRPLGVQEGMNDFRNAAQYTLDAHDNEEALEIVKLLMDYGIDVNHKDAQQSSLLQYVLDAIDSYEYEDKVTELVVGSRFELPYYVKLKGIYDRIMVPKITNQELNYEEFKNIFDYTLKRQAVHWFESHLDIMSEEEVLWYKDCRFLALFEN